MTIMEPVVVDVTIEGLCAQIRAMIADRQAKLMSMKHADPDLVRDVQELKKILLLVREAFAMAVPDWRTIT